MSLNALGRLEVVFRFVDASAPGVASAQKNITALQGKAVTASNTMRSAFMGAFPAFTTLMVVGMAGRAIGALIKPSMELGDSLRRMQAFANTGGEDFNKFKEGAVADLRAIGLSLGFYTKDMVDAFTELSKKGIAGSEGIAAMVPVARLARTAMGDLNEAVEVAATLSIVWGYHGRELAHRMDQLAYIAKVTRLDVSELMDVITRSATGVAIARPEFEDFIFILGATRDISQSASVTGTQLRRSYEALIAKTGQLAVALGVPLKNLKTEGYRNLSDILWDVTAKAKTFAEAQSKMKSALEAVGVRAVIPYIAVMKEADKIIKKHPGDIAAARMEWVAYKESLAGVDGELKKLSDTIMEANFAMQVQRLQVALSQVAEVIGPSLIDPLLRMATAMTSTMTALSGFITGMKQTIATGTNWGKTLGVLGSALSLISRYLVGYFGILAVGRSIAALFNIATGYSTQAMNAKRAAMVKLTEADAVAFRFQRYITNENNRQAASFALSTGALTLHNRALVATAALSRGAAIATAWLGRGLKSLYMMLGGWQGLVITGIMLLMEFTDVFGSGIKDVDEILARREGEQRTVAEKLRDAGDGLGASIVEAADRLDKLFGEKIPVLRERTLLAAPEMMERGLAGLTAEQRAAIGPQMMGAANTLRDTMISVGASLRAGNFEALNQIDTKALLESGYAFKMLNTMAKELGDKNLEKWTEEVVESFQGLDAQIKVATEGQTEHTQALGKAGLVATVDEKQKEYEAAKDQQLRDTAMTGWRVRLARGRKETGITPEVSARAAADKSGGWEIATSIRGRESTLVGGLTSGQAKELVKAMKEIADNTRGVRPVKIDNIGVAIDEDTANKNSETPGLVSNPEE